MSFQRFRKYIKHFFILIGISRSLKISACLRLLIELYMILEKYVKEQKIKGYIHHSSNLCII